MADPKMKGKAVFWGALTAVVVLTAAIMLAAASAPPARAAVNPALPAGQLGPSQIFTDSYGSNNSKSTAFDLGSYNIVPCPAGAPLVHDATFYQVGLATPAYEQDWFRIQLGAQLFYTLSIAQQVPSDLQFSLQLFDPVNSVVAAITGQTSPSVVFYSSSGGTYYLQLSASNAAVITGTEDKTYQFSLCSSTTNITPTPSNVATPTPSTLTPDAYAPNDTLTESASPAGTRGTASFIAVGQRIDNLNFSPYTGRTSKTTSWFEFYGRSGSIYQVTTLNVQPGVETVLAVYQPVANVITPTLTLVSPLPGYSNPNNRYVAGARGSQVSFQVPNGADGLYWIEVTNIDPSPRLSNMTYSLQVQEVLQVATPGPSPTATPLPPTPTPFPGQPDRFEYNGDFDHATLIAPDVQYDNLNFVPYHPLSNNDTDNDFYKLSVKQGIYYTCQTLNLAPGVDTNIIIYNQDRVGIGGNDDISPAETAKGNFASRFSWLTSYTGYAYILVGEVNPPRANEAGGHTYSFRCDIGLPITPTPLFTATLQAIGTPFIPPTPLPPEPTMTPYPTPRTAQNLPVREISNATATPAQQPTATPRVVSINVQVFNDANRNGLLDPGEGISGVSVRLIDEQSGTPLGQTLTDVDGRVNFSVTNPGAVRLSVPLFGYSLLVNESSLTVRIAVATEVTLPATIP